MLSIRLMVACALLAAGLMPAWAQQLSSPAQADTASAAPAPEPAPPPLPTINRWVDEHGQVHYGDALPADARNASAVQVDPAQLTTPEQKAQADVQLQQYRDYLNAPSASPSTAAALPKSPDEACSAEWERYNAAVACASQYGGLTTAIAQNCPAVPQPQCGQLATDVPPVVYVPAVAWWQQPCAGLPGKSARQYGCPSVSITNLDQRKPPSRAAQPATRPTPSPSHQPGPASRRAVAPHSSDRQNQP